MKPKIAALSILKGVFVDTPYDSWIGPWLFNVWGRPKKQRLTTANQTEKENIARITYEVYSKCKDSISI